MSSFDPSEASSVREPAAVSLDDVTATLRGTETSTGQSPWLTRLELRAPDPLVCPFIRGIEDTGLLTLPIEAPDAVNRCAALRDPVPQSLRQQELVCLTSSHVNCPRYLRGATVAEETVRRPTGERTRPSLPALHLPRLARPLVRVPRLSRIPTRELQARAALRDDRVVSAPVASPLVAPASPRRRGPAMPSLRLPAFAIPAFTLPRLHLPAVRLPAIPVPALRLPAVHAPRIRPRSIPRPTSALPGAGRVEAETAEAETALSASPLEQPTDLRWLEPVADRSLGSASRAASRALAGRAGAARSGIERALASTSRRLADLPRPRPVGVPPVSGPRGPGGLTPAVFASLLVLLATLSGSLAFVVARGGISLPASALVANQSASPSVVAAVPSIAPSPSPGPTPTPEPTPTPTPEPTPTPTPTPTPVPTPTPTPSPTPKPDPTPTPRPQGDAILARFPELRRCPSRNDCYIYIVEPGNNLYSIARYYRVSYNRVLQMTPEITNPGNLRAGDIVRMPTPQRPRR